MPARVNTSGDIGNALVESDAYDKDNIFLTDEGWVYRHYKNDALTKFWDEIIVAGEVDPAATIGGVANAPVDAINDAAPTFESGDSKKDVEYSPNFGGGGGAAPTPPATGPAASVTLVGDVTTEADGSVTATATTSSNGSGLTVTYTATSGTASALAIAAAGSGYEAGDSFTVDGDTGVTGTVAI